MPASATPVVPWHHHENAARRMSLNWIKQKIRTDPQPRLSVPDSSVVVTESLLMELDHQIQDVGAALKERELAEKREKTGVDYAWLVNRASKPYQMQQVERFELEELCAQVLPTECGRVIEVFRVSMVREPPLNEIPRILRSIIIQTLEDRRPKEEDSSSWISKSLVNLRARTNSNRVMPVSPDTEEMEMGSSTNSSNTDPVFTITNEMNF